MKSNSRTFYSARIYDITCFFVISFRSAAVMKTRYIQYGTATQFYTICLKVFYNFFFDWIKCHKSPIFAIVNSQWSCSHANSCKNNKFVMYLATQLLSTTRQNLQKFIHMNINRSFGNHDGTLIIKIYINR